MHFDSLGTLVIPIQCCKVLLIISVIGLLNQYFSNSYYSSLLLQTFSRESAGVQSEEQENQRNPPNLPGRFVSQYHNPEEKSWNHSSKEIYSQAEEGER